MDNRLNRKKMFVVQAVTTTRERLLKGGEI